MIMLDDLPALRRKVEDIRRRRDQAEGARKQTWARLRKEFGVKTRKELKTLLRKLQAEERAVAVKWTRMKKKFEAEFKDALLNSTEDPFLRDIHKRQLKNLKSGGE